MLLRRQTLFALGTAGWIIALGPPPDAHTPVTSKYTYHQDVFPIFEARCSGCHAPDAVAPMSLLTYADAYPWAQSIKEELVNLTMPPWQPESGFGAFKHGGSLTASELDMVVEWANGGTPEGEPMTREVAAAGSEWPLGTPSTILAMPAPYTLGTDVLEAVRYFILSTDFERDTLIRAVDVRPGTPAIVRSAIVYVDTTGAAAELDARDPEPGFAAEAFATNRILAAWVPGQRAVALDDAGFLLPAGADLVLRLGYKKTWTYEGLAVEDVSRLGLYAADGPVRVVEVIALQDSGDDPASDGQLFFTQPVDRDVELLSLVPEIGPGTEAVQVEAVSPDGRRTPVIRLASPRPEWRTRYWFESPLSLPRGTTLEVRAIRTADPGREDLSVRFTLDLVAAEGAAVAPDADR